jgi:adenylate cyclase
MLLDSVKSEKRRKFYPISVKMIIMVSVIVLVSLLAVTTAATYFFRADNKIRAMEDTLNYSALISEKVNTDLSSITEKARLAAINLSRGGGYSSGTSQVFVNMMFERDPHMIFIGVMDKGMPDSMRYMQNKSYFISKGIRPDFKMVIQSESDMILRAFSREDVVFNPSFYFNEPVIGIAVPYDRETASSIIIVFYSMEKILKSISTGSIINSFIVAGNGDVIAHRDRALVKSKNNFASLPIITTMMTNPNPNAQTSYNDEKGERYLGAFSRIGFSDAAVISVVKEDIAFAMVYKIQRIVMWLTGIVLSVSFIVNFYFSRSLSNPIMKLTEASHQIQDGQYDLDIKSVSHDEIGDLTDSFREMAHGLAERENIKTAFGKFVNKQIAELVMNNEIKLGGERKDVAVFFSDIRSFTKISESLEPEEVVEFLNQYMTQMVHCINKTKGVVDKYIGDAIMAVWGAPFSSGNDAFNAVNASLMMRDELLKFNRGRGNGGSLKKPQIQIGCGIHCGPVLAGQIGSEDRMEYTVIGDTVNIASRIEALNKAFATDILISEETADRVKDKFRVVPMQKIKVKGKSEPLQIYAVLGRYANFDSPRTLDELRRLIGTADMAVEADGEELTIDKEVKYEILD